MKLAVIVLLATMQGRTTKPAVNECSGAAEDMARGSFQFYFDGSGSIYKPEKIREGCWKLVVDEEATKKAADQRRERQKRKDDLYLALRTRVLSDKEMQEVLDYGNQLLWQECVGICSRPSDAETEKRLNEAYLQQFRLRMLEKR